MYLATWRPSLGACVEERDVRIYVYIYMYILDEKERERRLAPSCRFPATRSKPAIANSCCLGESTRMGNLINGIADALRLIE